MEAGECGGRVVADVVELFFGGLEPGMRVEFTIAGYICSVVEIWV